MGEPGHDVLLEDRKEPLGSKGSPSGKVRNRKSGMLDEYGGAEWTSIELICGLGTITRLSRQ